MNRKPKLILAHAALLIGATVAGCASPLVGDWSSDVVANGRRNEMTLEADGTGDAAIVGIVTVDGEGYLVEEMFDIDWEESGSDYELDMSCTGSDLYGAGCSQSDFTMDCELRGDDDELKCSGDRSYASYEFRWELD